ncbi:unnamed protein product [Lactuca saligna]|uniref:V-type proton ATPase subunit E n=1 Tax=Lactuca saligna TaxID=75948 RepID=A0AA36EAC4_LACSI|nr:unnamed protein product [Lactuca saligna]
MNDTDVSKQIEEMVRFICQEADEKANEISLQLVEAERKKIQQDEYSMQLNTSRIKVLQAQDDLVTAMREDASKDVLNVSHHHFKHQHNYEALLKALIVQGLLRLKEPSVLLRCRKEDLHKIIVDQIHLSSAPSSDDPHVLSCSGDVVLASRDGKIVFENTLDARLDVTFRRKLPKIRKLLFTQVGA